MKKQTWTKKQQVDLALGKRAEDLFCALTGATKGSKHDDMVNHTDVWLDGKSYDVKMVKHSTSSGYVLVELKNVQGKEGWCSKRGADKIAFKGSKGFAVVDTLKLLSLVTKKMIAHDTATMKPIRVASAHKKLGYEAILYKPVQRPNRKDLFVYIKQEDIMPIVEKVYEFK